MVAARGSDPLRLSVHAEQHGVVGAALAVASGDAVDVTCHGSAGDRPVTPDTGFRIASVTKPMVAAVVAKLATRGALACDDAVATLVPELSRSPWAREATVRQVLANTSGVPMSASREWGFEADGDDALALLAASLADEPALTPPGEMWGYANTGSCVAGRVIECATGRVWERAMEAELFTPLGMHHTSFGTEAPRGPWSRGFAAATREPVEPWNARALGPGGGTVVSTVGDLVAFGQALLRDPDLGVLRETSFELGFTYFLDAWCLGMARFDWDGGTVFGWDGIGGAFRAFLRLFPEHDGVIALLVNTSNGRALYRSLVPEVAGETFGVRGPVEPEATVVEDLARFAGVYAWPDQELTVVADGDGLVVSAGGAAVRALPIDERNFLPVGDDPDAMTFSFSAFDGDGVPGMLHRAVWGFPRR